MVGSGNRRDEGSFTVSNTNVFAALETLRKKKKSDKEKGSSKGSKCSSKAVAAGKSKKAEEEMPVYWAPAPLTVKSWADVGDEDDDDYYATTAPPQAIWDGSGLSKAEKTQKSDPVEVIELGCISDRAYSNDQILFMEKQILGQLEWSLTVPTPYVFLVRFIKASLTDSNVENMVYFLAELGMMNYGTLVYCPSMIAASAVYAARCTLNKAPFCNETLKLHTRFSEQQLMDC